eukprot:Gb_20801 [translate_table: standard]
MENIMGHTLIWKLLTAVLFLLCYLVILPFGQGLYGLHCEPNMENCGFHEDKMAMHRIIVENQEHGYISYGALSADIVPCRMTGQSYYYCNYSDTQANPYTRGCTAIGRCQRDMS